MLKIGYIFLAACGFVALALVGNGVYANLMRAKITADVETPSWDMRTLETALVDYSSLYGNFPENLSALGPPPRGQKASASFAGLISAELASGNKLGYHFGYRRIAFRAERSSQEYELTADPIDTSDPKQPHYFTDHTTIVRIQFGRPANAQSGPERREITSP